MIEQPRYSSLSWQPIAFLQSARSSTWARLGRCGGGATSLEDLQGGWKVSLHVQLALEGLKPWPMLEERSGRHHAVDPRRPDDPANVRGDLVTDMPGLHGLWLRAKIFLLSTIGS